MRPTFERLSSEIKAKLGVNPYFRKDFIAFRRNYIFADVQVYIDRIEIGLPLPLETTFSTRLQKAPEGRFTSRVTHVAKVSNPGDVTDDLMQMISQAYNAS